MTSNTSKSANRSLKGMLVTHVLTFAVSGLSRSPFPASCRSVRPLYSTKSMQWERRIPKRVMVFISDWTNHNVSDRTALHIPIDHVSESSWSLMLGTRRKTVFDPLPINCAINASKRLSEGKFVACGAVPDKQHATCSTFKTQVWTRKCA